MPRFKFIAFAFAAIAALTVGAALAFAAAVPIALKPTLLGCNTGQGSYNYSLAWKAGASGGAYKVMTGPHCKMGGADCSGGGNACQVTCPPNGACQARLDACPVLPTGSPYVIVTAMDGSGTGRSNVMPPPKCS